MRNGDSERTRLLRATLLVVAAAACFSTIATFVSLSLRAGAPLLTVLSGRFAFGVLALAPIAGFAALGRTPAKLRRALVMRAGVLQAALVADDATRGSHHCNVPLIGIECSPGHETCLAPFVHSSDFENSRHDFKVAGYIPAEETECVRLSPDIRTLILHCNESLRDADAAGRV